MVSRFPLFAFRFSPRAFTLIELLTVISIIAILAALTMTTLRHFRQGDATLSATRQMLDDVGRARQLAISHHTTVYMIFVPARFWEDGAFNYGTPGHITIDDRRAATNLLEKQLTGYTFVTLRSLGDQPGQGHPRYLTSWKTLPDTSFIAEWKFYTPAGPPGLPFTVPFQPPATAPFYVYGFETTTNLPFPRPETQPSAIPLRPYPRLPYIAFNYLGQLTTVELTPEPASRDVCIPLAHGSVLVATTPEKKPYMAPADVLEQPPGNSVSAYNLIWIDALTGRARLEHPEIQP